MPILIGLAATILFVAYTFGPIMGVRFENSRGRFQIADMFSLMALWIYPFVLIHALKRFPGELNGVGQTIATTLLLVMASAVWRGFTEQLTQRGVEHSLARFMVVGVIVPLGIAATILFGLVFVEFLAALWGWKRQWDSRWLTNQSACLAALLAVAIGCRFSLQRLMRLPRGATDSPE